MPAAEDNIRTVSALATQLGNQISVQMLNYLSTTHDLPEGFRDLSHTFLDTCRTLWAIETGVTELAGANRSLPEVIIEEVGKKFDAAYRDMSIAGHWGSCSEGFNRPGHELRRIHDSLKRINETLQISGMAFHWSLGEARPEDSVGIGYSSLAAALDRISQGRSRVLSGQPGRCRHSINILLNPHDRRPRYLRRDLWTNIARGIHHRTVEKIPRLSRIRTGTASRMTCPLSSPLNTFLKPAGRIGEASSLDNRLMHYGPNKTHAVIPVDEVSSVSDRGSESHSAYHGKQAATPLTDTASSHRRPSPSLSRGDGNSQSMLSAAVRGRNYPLIEQLLTIGVSPDKSEHFHPLSEAVQQRDIEAVRLLLLHKADPNIPDSQSRVPLYLAVDQSFADGVTLLLKHGADANYRANAEIESPLSHAITSGNVEITRTLLTHAGNLAENARHDATFLIDAIRKRTPQQIIDLLLDAGCDPDLKDRHGKTALCEAVQTDQPSVVTTLLDHHANPNLPGPEHVLWSAVHRPGCLRILLARGADIRKAPGIMEQATSVNNIDGVRVLLQAGIDPNLKKDGIYTPLCSAIRDDRPDIVSLLLSHSADPNAMASEYPAWKCITHNRLQYLPELLVAGANLRDPPGIAECAVANNNAKALRWVIEQGGANPNDRNSLGHTALTTALREDRPEMVKWLLEHGADPNLRGEDWPIYMAIRSSALLQLLLPYISDLSIHKGVMEKAVQADQLDSVKQLIAAGVNVEWKSGGVFSPLTTALRERHKPIVRYLLNEAGADPNAPGEHLPLVKAIRRCEPDDYTMIELLLEKGADPR
ncbi:hypothetical protein N7468_010022 [Penicillium chermesinum]|uniref:Ankyrin repeat protein n=1 Tax=Penicillium chermesinum TaxID=63820 RepID=A0A9W9NDN3_9EURO|nr:uncharacterized protein N7468_010022 [Penicillium chermesinum]KAJ5217014.1 hypothetical protein N7468_010022 [Penicillium chermesinum]